MAVQELRLAGKRFAIMPWSDFEKLQSASKASRPRKLRPAKSRLSRQDRGDVAEAKRREKEPSIPWEVARKQLGL